MLRVSRILKASTVFYRAEPIEDKARLEQLKASIGKPYPILRAKGSSKNIGTYMSLDRDKTLDYIKGNLAGKKVLCGCVTVLEVDPQSFKDGDGGIDEAIIITNIGNLVSEDAPLANDPLRISQRKQMFLKTFGPGVQKYLNDPVLSDPKMVDDWYNPEFNKNTWDTINSGEQAIVKPGDQSLTRVTKALTPLAEKIRKDPDVIEYFLTHRPEGWVDRNFRMNSDGSGTRVKEILFFDKDGHPSLF